MGDIEQLAERLDQLERRLATTEQGRDQYRARGYLVADAHVVYDHLYAGGDVTEVNCWAHARRYFFKAMSSDPDRAKAGFGFIQALFRIDRSLADAKRGRRLGRQSGNAIPLGRPS